MTRRILSGALAIAGLVLGLTACGSPGGSHPAAAPPPTSPTVLGPVAPSPSVAASSTTLTAEQVADTGLPSKVKAGPLAKPQLKKLLQYFENHVGHAYAAGNADELDHYLAGPMLSGNRATINLLNSKHRRNVFRIKVRSVKVDVNQAHHVQVEMSGDMTLDYFVNTTTHKLIDQGLPGPSQVEFFIFLDENPQTHTWYWTGEKSATTVSSNGSSTQ